MVDAIEHQLASPLQSMQPFLLDACPIPAPFKGVGDGAYWRHGDINDVRSPSKRIGVVLSGGPAPGGHDVIAAILQHCRPQDTLIGFLHGFGGLLKGQYRSLDPIDAALIEGTAGFDYLGTDRTKIRPNQFEVVRRVLQDARLDALIVVGGDDSNTNAMHLATACLGQVQVIGVPKTIDGDMMHPPHLMVPFGFHTATNHYASLVSALAVDAHATERYIHVVRLMGRQASHITLAVANQVMPHGCLLAEEAVDLGWSESHIVGYMAGVIRDRVQRNRPYGVMIFPEGLVEVMSTFHSDLIQRGTDDHGNVNISGVSLEHRLIDLIQQQLDPSLGVKMVPHFFGYTGRSLVPTAFDSAYAGLLGKTAYELVLSQATGMVAGCDFRKGIVTPCGIPLGAMMHWDDDRNDWVVKKSLVDTTGTDYNNYRSKKDAWVGYDPEFPRNKSPMWPSLMTHE